MLGLTRRCTGNSSAEPTDVLLNSVWNAPAVEPSPTVDIRHRSRGGWEVALRDRTERLRCDTFDDARRLGYQLAARRTPCQLVVRDAYDRVVHRELVSSPHQ